MSLRLFCSQLVHLHLWSICLWIHFLLLLWKRAIVALLSVFAAAASPHLFFTFLQYLFMALLFFPLHFLLFLTDSLLQVCLLHPTFFFFLSRSLSSACPLFCRLLFLIVTVCLCVWQLKAFSCSLQACCITRSHQACSCFGLFQLANEFFVFLLLALSFSFFFFVPV